VDIRTPTCLFFVKRGGNEQDVATNKGDKHIAYNIHVLITQKNHTSTSSSQHLHLPSPTMKRTLNKPKGK
jgi:hypothetical protein